LRGLRDRVEAVFCDEGEELERSSLRMLLAALPLTDQAGGHVQIASKDRVTCSLFSRGARICLGFKRGIGVRQITSNLRMVCLFIRPAE
jgi:hypothetical protein